MLLGAIITVTLIVLFIDWTFTVTGITGAVIKSILDFIISASRQR